ncbi:YcgN family cysteine cluster protein [Kaarinaea lacus]
MKKPFWEVKSLAEMNRQEWESLCDGCARCCLIKLEDEETGDIHYTNVVCNLLDLESCRCTQYQNRSQLVPECVVVTPEVMDQLHWMPSTCAYRLLWEGKPLPAWHPLVSGDPDSVHLAGISVRGRVYQQREIHDEALEDHIVHWPE